MNYKEFCTEFQKRVVTDKRWEIGEENVRFYEDGYRAEDDEKEQEFIRNTNLKYHHVEKDILMGDYVALYLGEEDGVQSICRFSMEYLYQEYEYDGWERVWDIVRHNIKMSQCPDKEEVLAHIMDYDMIKERLLIRPINYTDNRLELKNCVYKQIGDIALVLYILVYDEPAVGVGTTKVQRCVFDHWGKELEEVWNAALFNTSITAPPRMYMSMLECLKRTPESGSFMELTKEQMKKRKIDVPTVSTAKQTNGAIALFYPKVKEKIAELLDASYYVAFTSVHDARIHPEGTVSPYKILQGIKNVNKAFGKDELLTRKVYFYDREKKTFEIVEV